MYRYLAPHQNSGPHRLLGVFQEVTNPKEGNTPLDVSYEVDGMADIFLFSVGSTEMTNLSLIIYTNLRNNNCNAHVFFCKLLSHRKRTP